MVDSAQLRNILPTLPIDIFAGTLYRAIDLEALFGFHQPTPYPAPRPLYGFGASWKGARYTPKSGMSSLYLAETPETALAEAQQAYRRTAAAKPSVVGATAPPTVMVAVKANIISLLDLTRADVCHAIQTDEKELTAAWRLAQHRGRPVPTQDLGHAVFESGLFQAVRYPSARHAGNTCIVIFPDRLTAPSFVEVYDPHQNIFERLP